MNFLFPTIAYAATFEELIAKVSQNIINPIIGILFALAFLLFMWGGARFVLRADDENEVTQGKQHLIWGLIGMFIMVAVYGILNLITGTFGGPAIR